MVKHQSKSVSTSASPPRGSSNTNGRESGESNAYFVASVEETIRRNFGLIPKMCRIYKMPMDDDLKQIGDAAIARAHSTFDVSRGVKFSTVACTYIGNALGDERRRRKKWRHQQRLWSAEAVVKEHPGFAEVDSKIDALHYTADLDVRTRKIVKRRLHGETLHKIGERYGITKERVRQIQVAAYEKMSSRSM